MKKDHKMILTKESRERLKAEYEAQDYPNTRCRNCHLGPSSALCLIIQKTVQEVKPLCPTCLLVNIYRQRMLYGKVKQVTVIILVSLVQDFKDEEPEKEGRLP